MGYCVIKSRSKDDENKNSEGKGVVDMPRGDGTGPMGLGSMTGRAAGFCAGNSTPGYVNPASGRGYFGQGRGFIGRGGGRGRRNWFCATGLAGWQRASMGMPAFGGAYSYTSEMTPDKEIHVLQDEADFLKNQLADIQGRIETLGKIKAEKNG
jgi:hypothetical protein